MLKTARKQVRLVSLFIVVAMITMHIFVMGGLPVQAITDAVVNTTTGVGYGDNLEGALNAASPGDVIEVYSGDYGDPNDPNYAIVINKPLTLIAPNGPITASIDKIEVEDTVNVTVDGFTIGKDTPNYGFTGIYVAESVTGPGSLTIQNCVFVDKIDTAIEVAGAQSLAETEVFISNNTFNDFNNAVSFGSDMDQSTSIVIAGNVFTNGGEDAIYFSAPQKGSIRIDNCVFNNLGRSAIFMGEYASEDFKPTLDDISISITNNDFSVDGDAVQIAAHVKDSDFLLSGNSFKSTVISDNVWFWYDLEASSVHVFNNIFEDFDEAVSGRTIYDGSEVVIEGNTFKNGSQAFSLASVLVDSSVWFSDNQLESCDEGVFIVNMGDHLNDDSSMLIIENNRIDQAIQGIVILSFYKGRVSISNNILQDCSENGIYFGDAAQSTFLTIEKNQFLSCGHDGSVKKDSAIYIDELRDDISAPTNLLITQNRFMKNNSGIRFSDVYLQNPTSSVAISHNDFVGNVYGINLFNSWIAVVEPDQFHIGLNHFSGNEQYALVMNPVGMWIQAIELDVIAAAYNWWGDETGPFVKNVEMQLLSLPGEGDGDPISANVDFDPWIASLKLTVAKAQAETGTTQEVTAQILNSDGVPIDASGLSIVFTITGANPQTITVPVTGLNTIASYIGSTIGTDTISAEVIFAGESSGLVSTLQATWIAPAAAPSEPTPTPGEPTQAPDDSTKTGTDPADTSEQIPIPKTGQRSSPIETALPVLMLSLLAVLLVVRHTLKQMKQD